MFESISYVFDEGVYKRYIPLSPRGTKGAEFYPRPKFNPDQFLPNSNLNVTTIHVWPLTSTRTSEIRIRLGSP